MNIGPLELVVLAFVGLIVIGPEKMPGLARDAAKGRTGAPHARFHAQMQGKRTISPPTGASRSPPRRGSD